MSNSYVIQKNSIHERFMQCRSKVQIMGGGFANGKTAASCIKAIMLAKDYPGSNGLVGRATYPKLNDTIKREFMKWCPAEWIKRKPTATDNTLELHNGSLINFRYVQQRNSNDSVSSTSNLLSATYDWIVIDQMDDPEFEYKDYIDLLGRLRGSARYVGNDPTMPATGPRWFIITLNPTRNWIFKRVIKYVLEWYEHGTMSKQFREMVEEYTSDGDVDKFITVITGSTEDNAHNLSDDYIRSLKATYHGTMRERFLEGGWQAYTGLVYPMYEEHVHMLDETDIERVLQTWPYHKIIESYDWGLARPACYLLFCTDGVDIICVDGFLEKNLSPAMCVERIKEIRGRWGVSPELPNPIYADPAIFRRTAGEFKTIGKSLADVFNNSGQGVRMVRGNNDIKSGIIKVSSYLTRHPMHRHLITGQMNAPFLYFNRDRVAFIDEEITDYYWKNADNEDEIDDIPVDKNDHAMDALKYALTGTPNLDEVLPKAAVDWSWMRKWHERPDQEPGRRYFR